MSLTKAIQRIEEDREMCCSCSYLHQENSFKSHETKSKRKMVRFAPDICVVHSICHDTPTNIVWYDNHEYSSFRDEYIAQAKVVARFNRRSTKSSSSAGGSSKKMKKEEEASQESNNNDEANINSILKAFRECCQKPDNIKNEDLIAVAEAGGAPLTSTLQKHPDLLGLERMAAREIFRDKPQRRSQLIKAVCHVQQQQRQREDLRYAIEDNLRRTCERITRPSRLFAELLGQAAAMA